MRESGPRAAVSEITVALKAVIDSLIPSIDSLTPASYREMKRFYVDNGWFVDSSELEAFKSHELHSYFELPDGVTKEWEHALYWHFVEAFRWVEGPRTPQDYLDSVRYRRVGDSTHKDYARNFVKIFRFLINVSRKPLPAPYNVKFPEPKLIEDLLTSLDKKAVFSVVFVLMKERIKYGQLSLVDAIVRIYCVRPDFTLKDSRHVQPMMSWLMKLDRLSILAMAGILEGRLPVIQSPSEESTTEGYDLVEDASEEEEEERVEEGCVEDEEDCAGVENFPPPPRISEEDESVMAAKIREWLKYLDPKESYTFKTLVRLKYKAKKYAQSLDARIVCTEDKYVIYYNGIRYDLRNLSRVYLTKLKRVKEIIELLSLGQDTSIRPGDLIDDHTRRSASHKDGESPLETHLVRSSLFPCSKSLD